VNKAIVDTLAVAVLAAACAKDASGPVQGDRNSADDASSGSGSSATSGSSSAGEIGGPAIGDAEVGVPVSGDAESLSASDSSSAGPEGSTSSSEASPSGGEAGADAGAPGTDRDIASIVGAVSADRISQSIQTLVAFGTRSSCSPQTTGNQGIGAARDWIKAQFDTIGGLTTSLFTFAQTGCTQSFMRDNVLAVQPGTTNPDRLIVVGGHYDSRTLSVTDGTSPAPGANDSGSQTALVLELARVFAGHTFDASIMFVAFAGEEQGLVGSKALASNVGSVVPNGQVVAMLNCDIVGGNTDTNGPAELQQFRLYSPGTPREVGATTPDGTTDDTSPSRGLMRYVATWGSQYVPQMTIVPELREDRPGRGGDHESFIAASRPGVRFIETIESPNAGTMASHEHSPNDLFMYVTPSYTARVAQVVASVAASLARAPDAPSSLSVSGSGGGPMLNWSAPTTGAVDHYVVAARATTENFYQSRVRIAGSLNLAAVAPSALGVDPTQPFFVSVGAVDASGHESLFAYPEYRCDPTQCVVPAAALNITATN
jgi:Zn-dependent M28 family amino/carboxypeptidase